MPQYATNVRVSPVTYEALDERKSEGESFDDVLRRELGIG
jgi:predicted CopG family antitoxin